MSEINTEMPRPGSRRHWHQYSLRSLLIAITIFALWLGYYSYGARRQAAAVKTIAQHGGQALYDYNISGSWQPIVPTRVREWLGEDFFVTVVRVNFPDGKPTGDDGVAALKGLSGVTVINTNKSGITDAGLAYVAQMRQLQILRLKSSQITGAGLKHLRHLRHLQMLDLSGNRVTDTGLANLTELTTLEYLTLDGTDVTDAGLHQLRLLPQLKHLNVQHTLVTGDGVKELQRLLPKCEISY